jgi:hypothetical protein
VQQSIAQPLGLDAGQLAVQSVTGARAAFDLACALKLHTGSYLPDWLLQHRSRAGVGWNGRRPSAASKALLGQLSGP